MNINPINIVNTAKTAINNIAPNFKGNENAVNNKGLKADTVQISKSTANATPETKMLSAVNKILDEDLNLQKGEAVVVKADKTHVPF